MATSRRWSCSAVGACFRIASVMESEPSGKAGVDHLDAQRDDDNGEEHAQYRHASADKNARANQRAAQHAEHDRHGERRHNVATADVNASTGSRSDPDHEITCGGGYLEGE